MTAYPPSARLSKRRPVQAPAIGWLVPVAAAMALVGAVTPWFVPTAERNGVNVLKANDALYSFMDLKVGLAPPVLLVILSGTVISLLRGKVAPRFARSHNPVESVGNMTIGFGVVMIVCLVIAWFLVPVQYHFTTGARTYSWHYMQDHGVAMGRGPQLGFYVTLVATALAVVSGVAMVVMAKREKAGWTWE